MGFVKFRVVRIAVLVQEIVVVHRDEPAMEMVLAPLYQPVGMERAMQRPTKTAKAAQKTANVAAVRSAAADFVAPTTHAATEHAKPPTVKTAIRACSTVLVLRGNSAKAANARRSRLVETERVIPRASKIARLVRRIVVVRVVRSVSGWLVASSIPVATGFAKPHETKIAQRVLRTVPVQQGNRVRQRVRVLPSQPAATGLARRPVARIAQAVRRIVRVHRGNLAKTMLVWRCNAVAMGRVKARSAKTVQAAPPIVLVLSGNNAKTTYVRP